MVRVLAILLENDFPHKPIIYHAIIILSMVCVIGVVILNCGHKAKRRPQPANNMTYYGSGGGGYNYPSNTGGGKGGMGGAALGLAAGAGVGLAAGLAIDAVIDNNDNSGGGGGGGGCGSGCGGGGGGCGGGGGGGCGGG